jgi:hypothetical protein
MQQQAPPRGGSMDRRYVQETSSAPVHGRPLSAISFGDFSIDNVVDADPPRQEERQRRGPNLTDQAQEVISFGEVRVFRRAGRCVVDVSVYHA